MTFDRRRNIFLAGFMGTGKTGVGLLLAERLGRKFVDTDELIEKRTRRTIPQIFAEDGEGYFREVEHECVIEAARIPGAVISLGGGAVTQERNWDIIRRYGVCICLWADPETILERVRHDQNRPLLAGLDDEGKLERIKSMLKEREKFYRIADVAVSTSEASEEMVVETIIEKLRELG